MTNEVDLSTLLGEESQPVEFPMGLIGLEEWQRFILITHPAGEPLRLLQALDDDRFSLIVADPRQIVPGYQVRLSEADVENLKFKGGPGLLSPNEADLGVYCILSVQAEPFGITANLLGPLVINWQTGLGRQVILSDSNYNARHVLNLAEEATPRPSKLEEGVRC